MSGCVERCTDEWKRGWMVSDWLVPTGINDIDQYNIYIYVPWDIRNLWL